MSLHGQRRTGVSLVLLALGLGFLFAGRFVQFDDTSGVGGGEWILPLGLLAIVAAVASIVVAWPEPKARLRTGIALVVLFAGVLWQLVGDDGFRFVWHRDEGGLVLFEFVLGLTGFGLIATGAQPAEPDGPGPMAEELRAADAERQKYRVHQERRWMVRAWLYLCGTAVLTLLAFAIGISVYESTECDDGSNQCDLAVVGGMAWAVTAFVAGVVAITIAECVRAIRRDRARRTSGEPGDE
ncbi:hypothetical protein [Kribbella sindirgiensis]|uniref:Transmembrane protein n=1 Tax=Kribbella sindirgiensis TaxID=1124744 RepID=A0A4R0IHT6_9ACTN|nr:hypothetical protein [Kribbella sindirgiensis]TCC30598.1 hypothetical protein E0H50_24710 [Kribbella sindirgiensis]